MIAKSVDISKVDIRFIDSEEWETAMSLAYETYLEFDAKAYSDEGNEHFKEFVTDSFLKKMFEAGNYQVIGAYYKGKMIGVISLRDDHHISLLFVDKEFHNQGIGRSLIMALADYVKLKLHQSCLTVNAAPYAFDFYRRVGFRDEDDLTTKDGITFIPMKLEI